MKDNESPADLIARLDLSAGESPYAWTQVGPAFARAFNESPSVANAFVSHWANHLARVLKAMAGKPNVRPGDVIDAVGTYRSLALLADWWMPSRYLIHAPSAATRLREAVVVNIVENGAGLRMLRERMPAWLLPKVREDLEGRGIAINALAQDSEFVGRVALQLATYDPRTSRESPHQALSAAVRATLTPVLDAELGPLKVSTAGWKKTLPDELRRRLRNLGQEDPDAVRLREQMAALSEQHRDLLLDLYAKDGGFKIAHRRISSGSVLTRRTREAQKALLDVMPELAMLPPTNDSKRQATAETSDPI